MDYHPHGISRVSPNTFTMCQLFEAENWWTAAEFGTQISSRICMSCDMTPISGWNPLISRWLMLIVPSHEKNVLSTKNHHKLDKLGSPYPSTANCSLSSFNRFRIPQRPVPESSSFGRCKTQHFHRDVTRDGLGTDYVMTTYGIGF